ncbi:MAG: hypothetical protein MNPFHGCM_02900 [Gemmatimonadaceae bacterium]|nr:hypothetical protein [Gemmatimonadaceae bacterium]
MSERDPSDLAAFRQLEQVVRHLGETLAAFRRRALQAEARVRALEAAAVPGVIGMEARVRELEAELAEARSRLLFAGERTQQILDQVRFLRQQEGSPVQNGNGER